VVVDDADAVYPVCIDPTFTTEGKANLGLALGRVVKLYQATDRSEQAGEWKKKLEEFHAAPTNLPSTNPPPAKTQP
jgi:hypothetical protein